MKYTDHISRQTLAASLIFIGLIATGFMLMPRFADDLWYLGEILSYRNEGCSSLEAAGHTIRAHYMLDNGRLANIVFTLLLLLPKWAGNLIGILAIAVSLWLTYRVISKCSGRAVEGSTAAVVITLFAWALPWYEYIYLECYQINYLVPTALSMAIVWNTVSAKDHGRESHPVVLFLSGAVTAAWHEGFGAPLLAGIALLMAIRSDYRTKSTFALAAGLLAGLTWIFAAPAALGRLGDDGSHFFTKLLKVTLLHPAFVIMVITGMVKAVRQGSRVQNISPVILLLVGSAAASYVINLLSITSPRAGWWCDFASIVVLGIWTARSGFLSGRPGQITALVLLILSCCKMEMACNYAWLYHNQYSRYVSDYTRDPSQPVFLEFTPEYASPLMAWMAPSFNIYHDHYQRWMFAQCYGPDDGGEPPLPVVIPESLKNAPFSAGIPMEGNLEARRFGDYFVCTVKALDEMAAKHDEIHGNDRTQPETDSLSDCEIPAELHLGSLRVPCRMFCFPYTNSHGEELALLIPWRVYPLSPILTVTGINGSQRLP